MRGIEHATTRSCELARIQLVHGVVVSLPMGALRLV